MRKVFACLMAAAAIVASMQIAAAAELSEAPAGGGDFSVPIVEEIPPDENTDVPVPFDTVTDPVTGTSSFDFNPRFGKTVSYAGSTPSDLSSLSWPNGWSSAALAFGGFFIVSEEFQAVPSARGSATQLLSNVNSGYLLPAGSSVDFTFGQNLYQLVTYPTAYSPDYSYPTNNLIVEIDLASRDSGSLQYVARSGRLSYSNSDGLTVHFDAADIKANVQWIRITFAHANVCPTDAVSAVIRLRAPVSISYAPTQQIGLLAGILDFIRGIFETVINLPGQLSGWFAGVVSAITALPGLIVDGIKNLFLPSSDDLEHFSQEMEALLSNQLGFLYDIGSLISQFYNTIAAASRVTTITFPGINLQLAGATFSLASQDVRIWPTGFTGIRDAVRLMGDFVLIGAWLAGMQKYLDRFLGGGSE